MSLFKRLFGGIEDDKTFEQDLELLIFRWHDAKQKQGRAMTIDQIGEALLDRAEQILDRPKPRKRPHERTHAPRQAHQKRGVD